MKMIRHVYIYPSKPFLPLQNQLGKLVNMMRVTGRFESDQQKLAPWGHGENFDIQQVPPSIRTLLNKIKVGALSCGAVLLLLFSDNVRNNVNRTRSIFAWGSQGTSL